MRTIILALIAALCISCASTNSTVITQIPKTVKEACDFYQKTKPIIVRYVQWAVNHWDELSPEQQGLLRELHTYLAVLDGLGIDVCAISDALDAIQSGKKIVTKGNVDWDAVLSTLLKIAGTAAQMKAQGAF